MWRCLTHSTTCRRRQSLIALLLITFFLLVTWFVYRTPRLHVWSSLDYRPLSVRRRPCHVISHVIRPSSWRIWPPVNGSYIGSHGNVKHDGSGLERVVWQNHFAAEYAAQKSTSHVSDGGYVLAPKVILRVGNFNFYDWLEGNEQFKVDQCPVSQCLLSTNYSYYQQTADALLISEINRNTVKKYLPKPSHQIWIAQHLEAPYLNRIDTMSVRRLINWTASYRLDSTIYYPFYSLTRVYVPSHNVTGASQQQQVVSAAADVDYINYAANRTKKVAWLATNPGDRNGRQNYVRELSKYIDVDVYGKLGKVQCGNTESCFAILRRDYKFYLAFENSNCHYYITEKLFRNALKNNLVPVVMGARPEDYAAVLPPGSFIHVDDFRSARDLAEYLRRLDADDRLYNNYFRWKRTWTVRKDSYWCRLCAMLHAADIQRYVSWYSDYDSCWNGVCDASWTDDGGGLQYQTWRSLS